MLGVASVNKSEVLRNGIVEDYKSDRGQNVFPFLFAVDGLFHTDHDGCMNAYCTGIVSNHCFVNVSERFTSFDGFAVFVKFDDERIVLVFLDRPCSRFVVADDGKIERTEDHVLCRNRNRLSVLRTKQVVCGKHKEPCFRLRFRRKGNVNRHLVAVKVRVERRTNKRVQFQRSAFNENGLERLNAETVKRRRAVKHYGIFLDYVFKCVPNAVFRSFNGFLRALDVQVLVKVGQSLHYKRLEKFESHFFRKTALIDFKFGADNDNGTSRIVNTFAEQVLSETSLLAFKHVGKGFQRSVVRTADGLSSSAVVYEGVNRFLQHSLLVADDYFGRMEVEKFFKTIVSVYNSSVKVVEVGRCKSAAVKLDHGTDIRRNYRDNVEYHPFGTVARKSERFNDFKSFEQFKSLLTYGLFKFFFQRSGKFFKVNFFEQFFNRFRAHFGFELIAVTLFHLNVFFFGKSLFLLKFGCGNRVADFRYEIFSEVKNRFELTRLNVKHLTQTRGDSFEIPDMRNGSRKFNVTHSFSSDLCFCDFNTAAFADLALVTESLVFAAMAFPVLHGTEDTLAEKTVFFGFKGSVIYCFRFLDLAVRPGTDLFGGCETYFYGFENVILFDLFFGGTESVFVKILFFDAVFGNVHFICHYPLPSLL